MKNVMIPTDLTVQSLSIVHNIAKSNPDQKINIYAIHMLKLSNDISDLMFLSKAKMYRQVPETFTEAVQALNNKYKGQVSIKFELFYGNTPVVLRNIMEGKDVTEGFLLSNYNYGRGMSQSADFVPFFSKSRVPVTQIPLQSKVYLQGQANMLSALLGTEETLFIKEKEKMLTAF